ncbi:hypothetical protein BH20ACT14_BH20ACT14_18270 [soil metagenome]
MTSSSGNSTDLRRSGCHSESHQPRTLRTRCSRDSMPRARPGSSARPSEFPQFAAAASCSAWAPIGVGSARGSKESAPSRWSLRPTIRLTSAEAGVTRRVINLRHSVLGASRTLGGCPHSVKAFDGGLVANCEIFFSHRVKLRVHPLALEPGEEKKEPGTRPGHRYSPSRERFRPPSRQTVRFRVVLLGGLRPTGAPCSAQRHSMQIRTGRSRACRKEFRAICGRTS